MRGLRRKALGWIVAALLVSTLAVLSPAAPGWRVVGWNDLGMHCVDADFSVFSLLPPFNNLHAQLIDPTGNLVADPAAQGVTATYEALSDAQGSINRTSIGKTNFWDHVAALFGVSLPPDVGLAGYRMPGAANTPQGMGFDPGSHWFSGEGIPITPTADSWLTNTYPMMRITARGSGGAVLATTDIVLPVSAETTCRACHGSGTSVAARPAAGWSFESDPERDYRLNVLKLHDDRELDNPDYQWALAQRGFNPAGLFATVDLDHVSILCASCHPSNALPGSGLPGIGRLTTALHAHHATVYDPTTGMTLDQSDNRSACYRCHPGSTTRCLRGAMGAAVAPSGELAMQCQSCHGVMSVVGASTRVGWLDEPTCQNCHTGTAVLNNGQIRYTDVFDVDGQFRQAVDATFATNPDVPAPGYSLYRFSSGHGGLQCSACHGSPHAIFPSSHASDNVQNIQAQGHAGTLVECTTCHPTMPVTVSGGPHGMHPISAAWVENHHDYAEGTAKLPCRNCHGLDYRGTVLSKAQASRTFTGGDFGPKSFWRGGIIGCYGCHNGPNSSSPNPNLPAVVQNGSATTPFETSVGIALSANPVDGDALTLRIVSQPHHGRVGLAGNLATFIPDRGFAGVDVFTFAAWDGDTDSNLGQVSVTVQPPTTPPPVPDGFQVAGDELRVRKLPGGLVKVTWDIVGCPSNGYHLVWYDLAGIASYTTLGFTCTAGATGEWVGVPPAASTSVVVVSDNTQSIEGSYGSDSAGLERETTAPSCGYTTKTIAGVCQ